MTYAGRVRGCVRSPSIAGAALLLLTASGFAIAQNPCTSCDNPAVVAACEEFRACQEIFRDELGTCVDEKCQCTEEQPQCRFPITPGRCTITLECVGRCYRETRRLQDVPSSTDCVRDLKAALRAADPGCRVSSAAARRACNRCVDRPAKACTPAVDERGSRCQQQCVRRILEKRAESAECYARCNDRCDGDSCATAMCERACRNSVCNALIERCSPEGDSDDGTARLNGRYEACCSGDEGDCDFDDDSTIGCTPTTTSSTSTSSTSSTSSTVSSTPTTTSSTSTTLL